MADLIRERNELDAKIAAVVGRPAGLGHIGEFIAQHVFDIVLHDDATTKGSDGVFTSGPYAGRSVNVKLYGKQESLLDLKEHDGPDFYLVLTGPVAAAVSSRGAVRPLVIDHVYLFDAEATLLDLRGRNRKVGVASSVRGDLWKAAEIYPANHQAFPLTDEQRELLRRVRYTAKDLILKDSAITHPL